MSIAEASHDLATNIINVANHALDTTNETIKLPGSIVKTTGQVIETTGKLSEASGETVITVLNNINSLVNKSREGYSHIFSAAFAVTDLVTEIIKNINDPVKGILHTLFFPFKAASRYINRAMERRDLKHMSELEIQKEVNKQIKKAKIDLLLLKKLVKSKKKEMRLMTGLTLTQRDEILTQRDEIIKTLEVINASQKLLETTEDKVEEAEAEENQEQEQKGGRKTKRRKTKRRKTKRRKTKRRKTKRHKTKRRNRNKTKKRI